MRIIRYKEGHYIMIKGSAQEEDIITVNIHAPDKGAPQYRRQTLTFNITVIQVHALTSNAEEAELEWFCEDLQELLELTPKTDVLFIIGDWNAKGGTQETPGVTDKFGLGVQNEAEQRLTEFCQENALVIANTLFQKYRRLHMDITRWSNQTDYILCSQKWRSSIQSAKTRPGVDCGSDHELLIAKFRLKLKKVGKPLDHSGMT